MELIAITGGIGSGKSVVAHIVKVMGFEVYDCDSRARALMTDNDDVKSQLPQCHCSPGYSARPTALGFVTSLAGS